MATPHLIVVSLRGSGTPLLAEITTALGYPPHGTMSGLGPADDERPGPGKVYPLLAAAYGPDQAALLLGRQKERWQDLEAAFLAAVSALWRVWWTRLGQPVTLASPVDPGLEARLTRVPDGDLPGLLPGRGCWYVNALGLQHADGGFLRAWQATGQPPVVFHHRDVRDRIISQLRLLSRPAGQVGSLPDHLVYRDIVSALPTMDAKITFALTDPGFPGMAEARECRWLLHHPAAVCVIAHEDLTGPAEARDRALTRLLEATGHRDPAAALATLARLGPDNDEDPAGSWREHFTADHERLLARHHGDLLPAGSPLAVAHA